MILTSCETERDLSHVPSVVRILVQSNIQIWICIRVSHYGGISDHRLDFVDVARDPLGSLACGPKGHSIMFIVILLCSLVIDDDG